MATGPRLRVRRACAPWPNTASKATVSSRTAETETKARLTMPASLLLPGQQRRHDGRDGQNGEAGEESA